MILSRNYVLCIQEGSTNKDRTIRLDKHNHNKPNTTIVLRVIHLAVPEEIKRSLSTRELQWPEDEGKEGSPKGAVDTSNLGTSPANH